MSADAVTQGIRVQVRARYSRPRSEPALSQWFFLYTIRITNESDDTVQLLNRHWVITDATGRVEEVRGAGVVGEQPVLDPGESFEYTSGCPLRTPMGTMEGSYQMQGADGARFEVEIPLFSLREPGPLH